MSLNILVVDDSQVMRKVIIRSLRLSGLPLGEVHEAANGEEGLRLLDRHWIDLALIDINMPVLDGVAMIDRVRADPTTADLSIIVVTSDNSEARSEQLRPKVAAIVHKPFTPEDLRDTVTRVLGVGNV